MKLVDDINKIASQSAERTDHISKVALEAKVMHDKIMQIISGHMYEQTEKDNRDLGAYLACATALATATGHFFEVSESVLVDSMKSCKDGKEPAEDIISFMFMLGSCLKTIDANIERSTQYLRKVTEDARERFSNTGELYHVETKGSHGNVKVTNVERLEDE